MGLNGVIKSLNHSAAKVTQRKKVLVNLSRYINIDEFGGDMESAKEVIKDIALKGLIEDGVDYSDKVVVKVKVQYKRGKGYLAKTIIRLR